MQVSPRMLFPYEELAKHYEHREKNYQKAIAVVQEGLRRLDPAENHHSDFHDRFNRLGLKYRLKRLRNKQSRKQGQRKET